MNPLERISVDPAGAELVVDIVERDAAFTSLRGSSSVALPMTIDDLTTVFVPPGRYTVVSSLNGVEIDRQVTLSNGGTIRPSLSLGEVDRLLAAAGGGGGSEWEEVEVPTDAASWNTGDATGTWSFPGGGVIKQTDSSQVGASLLSNVDVFGLAFAVQCDFKTDLVDDPENMLPDGLFCVAGADLGGGVGSGFLAGVGVSNGFADGIAYGDAGGSADTEVAYQSEHTYLTIVDRGVAHMFIDDVRFGWGFVPQGNGYASTPKSPLGFVQVNGAVTFSNLKLWRIPIPELP